MYDSQPKIGSILAPAGDVSDELDYAVNQFIMNERGMGLTACQPSLIELVDGTQAIHFNLDSTFVDSQSSKIMGYGQIGTNQGFVGEVYISYNPDEPDDLHMLYITPQGEIDANIAAVLDSPNEFPPQERPRGKY